MKRDKNSKHMSSTILIHNYWSSKLSADTHISLHDRSHSIPWQNICIWHFKINTKLQRQNANAVVHCVHKSINC